MHTTYCPACGNAVVIQTLTTQENSTGTLEGYRCSNCRGIGLRHVTQREGVNLWGPSFPSLLRSFFEPWAWPRLGFTRFETLHGSLWEDSFTFVSENQTSLLNQELVAQLTQPTHVADLPDDPIPGEVH